MSVRRWFCTVRYWYVCSALGYACGVLVPEKTHMLAFPDQQSVDSGVWIGGSVLGVCVVFFSIGTCVALVPNQKLRVGLFRYWCGVLGSTAC